VSRASRENWRSSLTFISREEDGGGEEPVDRRDPVSPEKMGTARKNIENPRQNNNTSDLWLKKKSQQGGRARGVDLHFASLLQQPGRPDTSNGQQPTLKTKIPETKRSDERR